MMQSSPFASYVFKKAGVREAEKRKNFFQKTY